MNNSAPRQMSVQTKINLALVLVLVAIMSASLFIAASTEKRLVLQVVEQQTKDAADSYFDSINTMMLTGTMAQREVLRNKILARPGVIDARIIRGDEVTKVFGQGYDHQRLSMPWTAAPWAARRSSRSTSRTGTGCSR